ncbi:putative anthocyanidin reductase [Primulina tabacum]|uniref:putative anthocyanidin reductase n=1 Tax=Primulina tabacum TaxID=48773 RepID=UPI003F59D929
MLQAEKFQIFFSSRYFQFAKENGFDPVSVITTTVGGSFLKSTVPASIQVVLSPVTGDPKLLPILEAMNSRMGSIALVHIVDISNAHIFVMEHPEAEGQYLCCINSCAMSNLVEHLSKKTLLCRHAEKQHDSVPAEISSKKLRDLGFSYNYNIHEIIQHTVKICMDCEFLPVM